MTNAINTLLQLLGQPYTAKSIDHGEAICRDLGNGYGIEVVRCGPRKYTVYVWMTAPHTELMGVYSGICGEVDLKDTLGYAAAKYGNLAARIQIEREDLPR